MSRRELERVELMGRVASGDLGLQDAAEMLGLSYRQSKRVWRRYREHGGEGLKHGNAGRKSNRGKPQKLRRRVLSLIQRSIQAAKDERFGPTLAAEHLAEEDGIGIDHETLRRWMLEAGLWSRRAEAEETSPAARAQVALWRTGADGRKLPRLVGRARATGVPDEHGGRRHQHDRSAHGERGNHLGGGGGVTGLDRQVRCAAWRCTPTGRSVYVREATPGEQLRGEVPVTQFGRMCQRLGIRDHRGQFAAGQRAGGAQSRHAPGSAGEETAAARRSPAMKRPTSFCKTNICRSTTGGFARRPVATAGLSPSRPSGANWNRFSVWRASE